MARFLACVTVGIVAAVGIVGCGDSGSSVSARDNAQETTTTTMPSTAVAYVGLTKSAAIAKAEADGRPWRIGSEDGEVFPATQDYVPDRVTFDINDGKVTAANFG